MKNNKVYYLLVSLVIMLLATTIPVKAAEEIILKADTSELKPRARTKVEITAVDETGERIKDDLNLLVNLSKGGLTEPGILEDGLQLTAGKGDFTYIAPSTVGEARILLIDVETNTSAQQIFKISKEEIQADWEEESAKITEIKGQVAVKKEEQTNWDAALKGMKLQPGDSIKTWEESWVTFELFDGSEIVLEPWTTIYIKSLRRGKEKEDLKQSVMKIVTGNIVCNAQKYLTPGSKFEVETESSAAGIRGTNFEFVLETTGAQEVIVYEGEVIFENFVNDKLFPVQAGERLSLPTGDSPKPEFDTHNLTSQQRIRQLEERQDEVGILEEEGTAEDAEQETKKEEPVEESNEQRQEAQKSNEDNLEKEESVEAESTEDETSEEETNNDLSKASIGSQEIGEKMYLTFSWQPVFEEVFGSNLSTGLDLTFYQDPTDSDISLGPNSEDEDLDNIFDWIEYDGDLAYLYYGDLLDISYGPNLLISNYENEDAKGTEVEMNNLTPVSLDWELLLPMDLKSISPWELRDSSTLYATRLATDFKRLVPGELGINYVVDTNDELLDLPYKVPTKGLSADLKIGAMRFGQPHIEIAKLEDFGAGTEVGIKGKLSKLFWFDTGVRAMGEEFSPNYFGEDYEYIKKNTLAAATDLAEDEITDSDPGSDFPNDPGSDFPTDSGSDTTYPSTSDDMIKINEISSARVLPNLKNDHPATTGMYIKVGMNLDFGKLSLGYEDYREETRYGPIISSQGEFFLPDDLSWPEVKLGYDYRQVEVGEYDNVKTSWLNRNTRFSWYLEYPITQQVFITLDNEFIPADEDVEYTREVNLTFPF